MDDWSRNLSLRKRALNEMSMKTRMKLAHIIAAGILVGVGAVAADEGLVLPPQGSALQLDLTTDGVQTYTCEAKEGQFEWSFKAREANLFDKQGRRVHGSCYGPRATRGRVI
jgi:Protein of unknown function (DUF3455)